MGNIIASQLNLDGGQAFTGAIVLCALLSTCATYAFIKNGFKKGLQSTLANEPLSKLHNLRFVLAWRHPPFSYFLLIVYHK